LGYRDYRTFLSLSSETNSLKLTKLQELPKAVTLEDVDVLPPWNIDGGSFTAV
jgi:hypothetical protein